MIKLQRLTASVLLGGAMIVTSARAAIAQYSSPPKDPALATVLGVIFAGGGQFYTGKVGRGFLELGSVVAGAAIIARHCDADHPGCGENTQGLGWLVAIAGWGIGVITAADDARSYNARMEPEGHAGHFDFVGPRLIPGDTLRGANRYEIEGRTWRVQR